MARPKVGGFTLLEVLVAFLMAALTLTVLLQIFSGGLRDVQATQDYGRALIMAQSRLASSSAVEEVGPGSIAGSDEGFDWEVVITPYEESAADGSQPAESVALLPVRLLQVQSTVSWGEYGNRRSVRLVTLRLVSNRK